MMNSRLAPASPGSAGPENGFDFELTDIAEARRVLDTESLAQFDVATVAPSALWKKLRRSGLPTDRALTGHAIDLLTSLPPPLRPDHLSVKFPRIVNALAEVWDEPDRCHAVLARLLGDDRKGRAGFPQSVMRELLALQRWTEVF